MPGDVIRLRTGDIVPADARLLDGDPVDIDQSALTGESLPVTRSSTKPSTPAPSSNAARSTRSSTRPERKPISARPPQLVESAHTVSHFQRAVLKIGNYLIIIAIALAIVILTVALVRGDRLVTTLQFTLILTVAAIPVAMPTVLSVTMAVGARLLAQREAIVSRLAAIEELAGMDVLCSDKTGTLTQNRLTLGPPFCVDGVTPEEIIHAAALASRAENQDPIDLAVLSGLPADQKTIGEQIVHFQPFDSVVERTEATVRETNGSTFKVSKGAPQVIQALAMNAAEVQGAVDQAVNAFAVRGFRSLGVARTDAQGEWRFLGVLPLSDPPRTDSRATIASANQMGVAVKMLTGDQLAIAREIAGQLGLGSNILDADRLDAHHGESAEQLADVIEQADGFAQVFPEHKFRIVESLQRHGHIVGMTGDGVNDAPPLKQADAGIAVSGATDAARAAADIVLFAPGLAVVIDAIKASRQIFQRMTSYAIYRIAETIRVLLFLTLSITLFNFYPITAVMIVLLALLNDGAILSIAYDNVHYSDQPERWNMPEVLTVATVLGVAGVIASFTLFALAERQFHLDRGTDPDADVPEAVGSRTFDDLRDAHARTVLVYSACSNPRRGRHRYPAAGDGDRDVRSPHGSARIGLGGLRVGLCAGLVPGQRSGETPHLSRAGCTTTEEKFRGHDNSRHLDEPFSWNRRELEGRSGQKLLRHQFTPT